MRDCVSLERNFDLFFVLHLIRVKLLVVFGRELFNELTL